MLAAPDGTPGRALDYARRGWPVFPCRPGGKEPATRHGFKDATTDPDRIRAWWNRLPDANVAIATGWPGPDVLDVDRHGPDGDGFGAYRKLAASGLLRGVTAMVATPGGGLHAYFTGTAQPSGRLPGHCLDFKAAGGYVVAPPSQIGGRRYRLLLGRDTQPGYLNWAEVTAILNPRRDHASGDRAAHADVSRLAAWVERLEEGNRNSGLFWAACRAIEDGHAGRLGELADAAARTRLPDQEIERTIASARRTSQPRTAGQAAGHAHGTAGTAAFQGPANGCW